MNMRFVTTLFVSLTLVVVLGCAQTASQSDSDATEAAASEMAMEDASGLTVEKARELGTLAVAMEKDPDRIPALLEEHGMSADELQAMLVQIAADADLTEAYEEAREEASAAH